MTNQNPMTAVSDKLYEAVCEDCRWWARGEGPEMAHQANEHMRRRGHATMVLPPSKPGNPPFNPFERWE